MDHVEFERPAWHKHAACRGMGGSLFFPERGDVTRPAKLICATCPVQVPCTEAGLSERFGIWGGESERGRRRLRRERDEAAA